jgi:hypothetical protein
MVLAAITGFAVSAQFVSLPGLETPYYIVLLGAGALKLVPSARPNTEAEHDVDRGFAVEQFSLSRT